MGRDNYVLMLWLGLGTENTWLGLGKYHFLNLKIPDSTPQTWLEIIPLTDVETRRRLTGTYTCILKMTRLSSDCKTSS